MTANRQDGAAQTPRKVERIHVGLVDGIPRIKEDGAYVYYHDYQQLERELAAAQAKSVTEEDTLAPIADCVASAHRNSNLPSPEFRPLTLDVVRERIWELSYEANRLRLQLSRPRAAGVSEDVLKIAREVLEEPSARANVRATLASTFGRATAGMVDDLEKMARELLRLHAILAGEGK